MRILNKENGYKKQAGAKAQATMNNHQNDRKQRHKDSCYARWKLTMMLVGVLSVRPASIPV